MKINAKQPVLTLKGEQYKSGEEGVTVGSVISDILATDQTGGKMKLFILAKKFYEEKEVELDEADISLVKKAVESCKGWNNVILGQILTILEK